MRERRGLAWIPAEVLRALEAEASAKAPNETGGVLLGYWVREGSEVVITEAIGPGLRAMHDLKGFLPDHEYQETEIAMRYEASGRRLSYLGDWHSHPGGIASLSRKDEKTLARIATDQAARAPAPLMALLAGADPWTLAVWCGRPKRIPLLGCWLAKYRLDVRVYQNRT